MRLYKDQNSQIRNTYYRQIMVPTTLRNDLIELSHSSNFAGHLGANKVYQKLSKDFFWPKMQSDIINFIKTCDICQKVANVCCYNQM